MGVQDAYDAMDKEKERLRAENKRLRAELQEAHAEIERLWDCLKYPRD
jgi:hypothetical protein